jgi:hypothetical protein
MSRILSLLDFVDRDPLGSFSTLTRWATRSAKYPVLAPGLLKPGGLLIIDDHVVDQIRNSRDQYLVTFNRLTKNWRTVTWHDGIQFSAGFFKPIGEE